MDRAAAPASLVSCPMPTPAAPVRLVVLNYNGGAFLPRCIERLYALDWPPDELEVVLVDNASTDGSVEDAEERFADLRIIRNPVNDGVPGQQPGPR